MDDASFLESAPLERRTTQILRHLVVVSTAVGPFTRIYSHVGCLWTVDSTLSTKPCYSDLKFSGHVLVTIKLIHAIITIAIITTCTTTVSRKKQVSVGQ